MSRLLDTELNFTCAISVPQSKPAWVVLKFGGTSTAGALHVIDPTRVYDSRKAGGLLASGGTRPVNIANGIAQARISCGKRSAHWIDANIAIRITNQPGLIRHWIKIKPE
jgi:hypothetical protein